MRKTYERFFAATYDLLMARPEKGVLRPYRSYLVGEARGRVLEIGAGTGANLPYYRRDAVPVLTDPNPHMLKRLKKKAARMGFAVEAREERAERLAFPDGSFDTVVATLALCTVDDLPRSLQEIRRVLAPGGELRFMEHVRASSPFWGRFQDAATPVWRRVGAGCHPNRDTLAAILEAGFDVAEVELFAASPYPVRPFIAGIARAPGGE